ncbi:MAG: tetratricopeptide repeat protein [Chloroflexota bacterium]
MSHTNSNQTNSSFPSDPYKVIGREGELQILLEALSTTLKTLGIRGVALVGEAGIGKSHLVQVFTHWATQVAEDVDLIQVAADPYQVVRPYSLWRSLVTQAHSIPEYASSATIRRQFESLIAPSENPDALIQAALLGHLLGFDSSYHPMIQALTHNPQELQAQGEKALLAYLQSRCMAQPLVLVIEDLHWTDSPSQALLWRVFNEGANWPLLVIVTTRPGRASIPKDISLLQIVKLAPLTVADSREVVARLISNTQVSSATVEQIIHRSGGNPLHLIALSQMMRTTSEGGVGDIPLTLTMIIRERFLHLSQEVQTILLAASSIGMLFWASGVRYLEQSRMQREQTSGAGLKVDVALEVLVQTEWIVPETSGGMLAEPAYRFKHAMVHEGVYAQLAEEEQIWYHQMAAAWWQTQLGKQVDTYASVIAEHYERGQCPAEAAKWYTKAGIEAASRYVAAEATQLFRQALALLPVNSYVQEQRFTLYSKIGKELLEQMAYTDAWQVFQTMQTEAEECGDVEFLSQAYIGMANIYLRQSAFPEMLSMVQQAEQCLHSHGESIIFANVLRNKAYALYMLGQSSEALPIAKRSLHMCRQFGDAHDEVLAINTLALVYARLRCFQEAENIYQQGLLLYRQLNHRAGEIIILYNVALLSMNQGNYDQALPFITDAVSIASEIQVRYLLLQCYTMLGEVYLRLDMVDDAIHALKKGLDLVHRSSVSSTPYIFTLFAEALLQKKQNDEALVFAQQGLEEVQRTHNPEILSMAWRVLGQAMTYQEDYIGATACFAKAEKLASESHLEYERARILRAWAQYDLLHGDVEQGRIRWQQARDLFTDLGFTIEVSQMDAETLPF